MSIRFGCPACASVINAPGKAAGSKASCPKCGQRIDVPQIAMPPKRQSLLPLVLLGLFLAFTVTISGAVGVVLALRHFGQPKGDSAAEEAASPQLPSAQTGQKATRKRFWDTSVRESDITAVISLIASHKKGFVLVDPKARAVWVWEDGAGKPIPLDEHALVVMSHAEWEHPAAKAFDHPRIVVNCYLRQWDGVIPGYSARECLEIALAMPDTSEWVAIEDKNVADMLNMKVPPGVVQEQHRQLDEMKKQNDSRGPMFPELQGPPK